MWSHLCERQRRHGTNESLMLFVKLSHRKFSSYWFDNLCRLIYSFNLHAIVNKCWCKMSRIVRKHCNPEPKFRPWNILNVSKMLFLMITSLSKWINVNEEQMEMKELDMMFLLISQKFSRHQMMLKWIWISISVLTQARSQHSVTAYESLLYQHPTSKQTTDSSLRTSDLHLHLLTSWSPIVSISVELQMKCFV